jgi:SAM-dependent methyltransferase
MLERKECPACLLTSFSTEREVKDFSVSKEVFKVQLCGHCGHRFTSPLPTEDNIGPYYDSPDYISHTNDGSSFFGKVYQQLRDINMSRKHKLVSSYTQGTQHLDYGCGTGTFLEYMLRKGYSSEGVEINEGARAMAGAFGSVYSSIDGCKNTYDAITLWHVLEHVYNLDQMMLAFHERLQNDGALFIAVPNPNSPDAKHYKEFWAAWDIPIHAHHFSKSSIEALAGRTGFTLKAVHPMKLDAYYISLLSEQYASGRGSKSIGHWIKGALQGWMSNLKAGNNNTSSLIYVLKKI